MTSPNSTGIVFYDIAMRPPTTETGCSPNPWKSRYALNFKGVSYTTTWVAMPDITKVRRAVGIPAGRKFADGTDFYTLPMITDPSHNAAIGDSFDIAVYLEETYPGAGGGNLLPPQSLDYVYSADDSTLAIPLSERDEASGFGEYVRFNTNVDMLFTMHVPLLVHGLPFDPAVFESVKAEFVRRSGVDSWDDLNVHGEAREKMKASFYNKMAGLARLLERNGDGPFVLGKRASYADFIVGGWLRMVSVCLPEAEWEEVRGWYGGVFGQLHDALQEYAEVK